MWGIGMGKRSQKKERELNMHEKRHRFTRYIVNLTIVIITVVCAAIGYYLLSDRYDDLRGTWTVDSITSFWFDGRGEGGMLLPSSEYMFHYEINEDIISIDFEDEGATDVVYEFQVEKDTLRLKGHENNSSVQSLTLNRSQ